ncbi:hypothetical protein [Rhodococcus phenolicus]|uniref:hypothetical protein n=1 Tax=Rhodococcus phenolicus TaxID=263849 RepID=UPI000AE0F4FC|nr:hypothetical protein [Rhodococcus phenolicus]
MALEDDLVLTRRLMTQDAQEWDEPMATTRVHQGVPAAYHGTDTDRDILSPETQPSTLFHGHPGRTTSPAVQHIFVDWVDLEDEPASLAVGYCPPTIEGGRSGPVVPGLAEISEDEYLLRKQRIEKRGALASPGQIR